MYSKNIKHCFAIWMLLKEGLSEKVSLCRHDEEPAEK